MRLIYLSPVPWNSFSQRPHRFVEWFHQRFRAEVLWVNPYATRLPRASDARRLLTRTNAASRNKVAWLTELNVPALPLEPLSGIRIVNSWRWKKALDAVVAFSAADRCFICIAKPSLFALNCLDALPRVRSLFDMMDDFPAFFEGRSYRQAVGSERDLLRRVDHIFFSSSGLSARCRETRPDGQLVLNGIDHETDWAVRTPRTAGAPPVFGYLGTLASWFDWEWVARLADAMPDSEIRLCGPRFGTPTTGMPKNVYESGAVEHGRAVRLMREFDVGLIPFRINQLTQAVDPIKYYEYRALGMPVLSTDFGEMSTRLNEPGVFISREQTEIRQLATEALRYSQANRIKSAHSTPEFVAANTWSARFDGLGLQRIF